MSPECFTEKEQFPVDCLSSRFLCVWSRVGLSEMGDAVVLLCTFIN